MKAFCIECQKQMEPGFTTIVTPVVYECDEGGVITEFDDRTLRPDWMDGIEFYGWWCPECDEWYNEADYRETDEETHVDDDADGGGCLGGCAICGRLTIGIYCESCEEKH